MAYALQEDLVKLRNEKNSQLNDLTEELKLQAAAKAELKTRLDSVLTAGGMDLENRFGVMQNLITNMQVTLSSHEKLLADASALAVHMQAQMANMAQNSNRTSFGGKDEKIMPSKLMVPDKFDGELAHWRRWKADVEGYMAAVDPEAAHDLAICGAVAHCIVNDEPLPNTHGETTFYQVGCKGEYAKGHQIWMLLKQKAGGEALRALLGP
jgi:hypothetical protein